METNMDNPAMLALDRRLTAVEAKQENLTSRTDLAQLETRLIKWLVATQLAVIGFLLSTQLAMAALLVHLMQ